MAVPINYIFLLSPYIIRLEELLDSVSKNAITLMEVIEQFDSVINMVADTFEYYNVGHDLYAALFPLVCLSDEKILSEQWHSKEQWAISSLQIRYYQRQDGGVEFFNRLDSLCDSSSDNYELIDVYIYCLRMGFRGKFKKYDSDYYIKEIYRSYSRSAKLRLQEIDSAPNEIEVLIGLHKNKLNSIYSTLYRHVGKFMFAFSVLVYLALLLVLKDIMYSEAVGVMRIL